MSKPRRALATFPHKRPFFYSRGALVFGAARCYIYACVRHTVVRFCGPLGRGRGGERSILRREISPPRYLQALLYYTRPITTRMLSAGFICRNISATKNVFRERFSRGIYTYDTIVSRGVHCARMCVPRERETLMLLRNLRFAAL